MTKITLLSVAIGALVLVGQMPAQAAELNAYDNESGPTWTTPDYSPAQIAAASHNGGTDLSAYDQESNPSPAPGYSMQQLAATPANDGATDLNPYDNAS
jgi:hypothetical protein